jgi:hypothetical protein
MLFCLDQIHLFIENQYIKSYRHLFFFFCSFTAHHQSEMSTFLGNNSMFLVWQVRNTNTRRSSTRKSHIICVVEERKRKIKKEKKKDLAASQPFSILPGTTSFFLLIFFIQISASPNTNRILSFKLSIAAIFFSSTSSK